MNKRREKLSLCLISDRANFSVTKNKPALVKQSLLSAYILKFSFNLLRLSRVNLIKAITKSSVNALSYFLEFVVRIKRVHISEAFFLLEENM